MPSMLRSNKKAEKIAFDILGVPQNMLKIKKRSLVNKKNERIEYENTFRQR